MFGGGEPLPDSDCNGAGVVAARKFDLPSKVRPEIELNGCRREMKSCCCIRSCAIAAGMTGCQRSQQLCTLARILLHLTPTLAQPMTCTNPLRPCVAPPPLQLRTLAGPLVYVLVLSTLTAVYHALAAVSFWRMHLRSSWGVHAGHLVTRQCSHGIAC